MKLHSRESLKTRKTKAATFLSFSETNWSHSEISFKIYMNKESLLDACNHLFESSCRSVNILRLIWVQWVPTFNNLNVNSGGRMLFNSSKKNRKLQWEKHLTNATQCYTQSRIYVTKMNKVKKNIVKKGRRTWTYEST